MDYRSSIWLIIDDEFEEFVISGGKVIYISESVEPLYATHPAVVTAGALLPPVEEVQAELNDDIPSAQAIYEDFLLNTEASNYIAIILAAAIQQIPIGLMFGMDESNFKFPMILINFLYKYYGLVVGIAGSIESYILLTMMPTVLATLYMRDMIDYRSFIMLHPAEYPILPNVLSKLVYDAHPFIKNKDANGYAEYFNNLVRKCKQIQAFPESPFMEAT